MHDAGLAGSSAAQADAFFSAAYAVTFLYFAGAEAAAQKIWQSRSPSAAVAAELPESPMKK